MVIILNMRWSLSYVVIHPNKLPRTLILYAHWHVFIFLPVGLQFSVRERRMNNLFVSAFAAATADTTTINAQRLRRLPVLNLSSFYLSSFCHSCAIARNILLAKSKLLKLSNFACWSYMSSHLKHMQKL